MMSPDTRPEIKPITTSPRPESRGTFQQRIALFGAAFGSALAAACGSAPEQPTAVTTSNIPTASPTAEAPKTCDADQWQALLVKNNVRVVATPIPAGGPADPSKPDIYNKWIKDCVIPTTLEKVQELNKDLEIFNKPDQTTELKQIAQTIGKASEESTLDTIRFERAITEPKGEVLFIPSNSISGELANLDLLTVSSKGLDTLFAHREDLVSQALEVTKDLSAGNKEQALAKLQKIKKLIEGQTRANKAGGINLDNNDNGVEDYIEPFHSEIVSIISKLQ